MDKDGKLRLLITNFARDNKDVPALSFINVDPDGFMVEEIVDQGAVNYIYRVRSSDLKNSIILKYGEEASKVLPGGSLTLERQVIEYRSLQLMRELQQGCVPEPFCFDRKHSIIAMEDMDGWTLLADALEAHKIDQDVPVYLGQLLAKMHQTTSKSLVSAIQWEELCKFRQEELKEKCCGFYFKTAFDEKDKINKIPEKALDSYRQYVKEVKALGLITKILSLYKMEECFIHADLHGKSIFVRDGRATLFDWEFAFLGHPASNLGMVVQSYYMYHLITKNQQQNDSETKRTLQVQFKHAISNLLQTYTEQLTGWSPDKIRVFITELALFTGGFMFASSAFGMTEYLANITDIDRIQLLHTSFRLMSKHGSLDSIDKLIEAMFEESKN